MTVSINDVTLRPDERVFCFCHRMRVRMGFSTPLIRIPGRYDEFFP